MKKTSAVFILMLLSALLLLSCSDSPDEAEETTYKVGDRGPAGGIVFYDAGRTQKSSYLDSDGNMVVYKWRYLEAAPEDCAGKFSWGAEGDNFGTEPEIGKGKTNTEILRNEGIDRFPAAKACTEYGKGTEYDDWFLPSVEELRVMYSSQARIGNFVNDLYWSSSEYADYGWFVYFSVDYLQYSYFISYRSMDYRVRPIRAFLE